MKLIPLIFISGNFFKPNTQAFLLNSSKHDFTLYWNAQWGTRKKTNDQQTTHLPLQNKNILFRFFVDRDSTWFSRKLIMVSVSQREEEWFEKNAQVLVKKWQKYFTV